MYLKLKKKILKASRKKEFKIRLEKMKQRIEEQES